MSLKLFGSAAPLLLAAGPVFAQGADPATYDFSINTFFVAISAILVMWMMAGFTVVEAGFVRANSVVNQCAKNIGLFAIASVCFLLVGYGLMFPEGAWIVPGIIGYAGPYEIAPVANPGETFSGEERAGGTIMFFQMMFCATIASIVSGALAERMKLLSFFIFTAVLTAVIYPIQASWAWGGGFLDTTYGFKDLAGSTVIHVAGGVAALTGTVIVGARKGRFTAQGKVAMRSFNLPLATLGAFILWMGWFGFNAGSYLSIVTDADAANVSRILLNTNLAGAAGVLGAAVISYFRFHRFDLSFMINGALAGLVSITAEPLYPSPTLALLIGFAGGILVVWAVILLESLKIDDVVGAIPVHFFCGIWGTLAVVLSNPDATWYGQGVSLAIVIGFVGATTFVTWAVIDKIIGVRVAAEKELGGVDDADMILDL